VGGWGCVCVGGWGFPDTYPLGCEDIFTKIGVQIEIARSPQGGGLDSTTVGGTLVLMSSTRSESPPRPLLKASESQQQSHPYTLLHWLGLDIGLIRTIGLVRSFPSSSKVLREPSF